VPPNPPPRARSAAQPATLRIVEFDAERAGNSIRDLETDPRQLDQPVRIVRQHSDDLVGETAHEPRGETG
jgi:hypothetical protein